MSHKTASVHVSQILTKLGVRGRVDAASVAHRLGLSEEPAAWPRSGACALGSGCLVSDHQEQSVGMEPFNERR